MKTISLSVSEADYEAFRRAAQRENRPIAQIIREAMADYRSRKLPEKTPLRELPVLAGHRHRGPLPSRHEIYDDVYGLGDA